MKVTFLGTGEACDPKHPNTSLLLEVHTGYHLLDCGFTVPHIFFHYCRNPEQLKTLWISHFHGDHFFGVPLLLLRLWEMGRKDSLQIISAVPPEDKIKAAMELAYPNFMERINFPIHFTQLSPGETFHHNGLTFETAGNTHSQPSFGLKACTEEKSCYYSGDGRATEEAEQLMHGCDLIVHEAFSLEDTLENHGSVAACIRLQEKSGCKQMALIHLARETREEETLEETLSRHRGLFLAQDGEELTL